MRKWSDYFYAFLLPLLLLAFLTPLSSQIDLWISHYFFREGHFMSHPILDGLYTYAVYPAFIVSIGSLLLYLLSFIDSRLNKWRTVFLYLVLTLAIGSGIVIHALLKEQWGRPRPVESIEFGGKLPFQPYYEPNFSDRTKPFRSFTCGHCTMGFYFFCFMWLGSYYQKRGLYWGGLGLAVGLGGLLSWLRIAQGGHFFTDTLVSALIMWYTALFLYLILFKEKKS